MYNVLTNFKRNDYVTTVILPFKVEDIIDNWASLRKVMVKKRAEVFTREEWAYLIYFLEISNLKAPFEYCFGKFYTDEIEQIQCCVKPRRTISIWLPNNVSLLGPLILILTSLSGSTIKMKAGSNSKNLTHEFYQFVLNEKRLNPLTNYLEKFVSIEEFDRDDSRNVDMAKQSDVRIAFGSTSTIRAIDALEKKIDSIPFYFIDRQSQAWIEKETITAKLVSDIIKVFAIYGQAGCTSPTKIIILDGSYKGARMLRKQIVDYWPKIIKYMPPMYVASLNILDKQLALAKGWEAECTALNGAVILNGEGDVPELHSNLTLPIVALNLHDAVNTIPSNIQTIGYSVNNPSDKKWLFAVLNSQAKRFVPITKMHHFWFVWDGYSFWHQLFEETEIIL